MSTSTTSPARRRRKTAAPPPHPGGRPRKITDPNDPGYSPSYSGILIRFRDPADRDLIAAAVKADDMTSIQGWARRALLHAARASVKRAEKE